MRGRLQLASVNVGTLAGKFIKLVDVLWKRKVDMSGIQETKWKGERTN